MVNEVVLSGECQKQCVLSVTSSNRGVGIQGTQPSLTTTPYAGVRLQGDYKSVCSLFGLLRFCRSQRGDAPRISMRVFVKRCVHKTPSIRILKILSLFHQPRPSTSLDLYNIVMADGLSFAASILAVLGTAESLSKALSQVRRLRHTPNELLALINKVSDLRIIINNVHNYTIQNKHSPQLPQNHFQYLIILINRAKQTLFKLNKLIYYKLIKPQLGPTKVAK